MGESLVIEYDQIGDFLFMDVCRPYAEQDSDGIDDEILARFNLETGEIETIEVLFFKSRLKKEGEVRIPVSATLRLASAAAPEASAQPPSVDEALTIKYDHDDDTLTIDQRRPYHGQAEGEIDDGVTARMNAGTGEIENLAIRAFKARLEKDGEIVLPVNATLRPVEAPVPAE